MCIIPIEALKTLFHVPWKGSYEPCNYAVQKRLRRRSCTAENN